ncbi:unnamed protein product, partial [Acidithrix sp. C25]
VNHAWLISIFESTGQGPSVIKAYIHKLQNRKASFLLDLY